MDKFRVSAADARSKVGAKRNMNEINFAKAMRAAYTSIRSAMARREGSCVVAVASMEPGGSLVDPVYMADCVTRQLEEQDGFKVYRVGEWRLLVVWDEEWNEVGGREISAAAREAAGVNTAKEKDKKKKEKKKKDAEESGDGGSGPQGRFAMLPAVGHPIHPPPPTLENPYFLPLPNYEPVSQPTRNTPAPDNKPATKTTTKPKTKSKSKTKTKTTKETASTQQNVPNNVTVISLD